MNDISLSDYGFCSTNCKQIYRFEMNLLQHSIEDDVDKKWTQTPSHFDWKGAQQSDSDKHVKLVRI